MTTYTVDLYKQIIIPFAETSSRLQVISGYASAAFLKRVSQQFSHLQIDLYIGMTHQGVSQQDHELYCALTKQANGICVYYQITPVPNHMKILRFECENNTHTFVGSANFSENGFLYQREIMAKINDPLQYLFDEQHKNSLLCTDERIAAHISFFEGHYEARSEVEEKQPVKEHEIEQQKEDDFEEVYALSLIHI